MRFKSTAGVVIVASLSAGACTPETELRSETTVEPSPDGAPAPADASPLAANPLAGQLVDPPAGATAMAINLTSLTVGFAEPVQVSAAPAPFVLRSSAGDAYPLTLGDAVPCARSCYRLVLPVELAANTAYALESLTGTLQFLDGKPVPGGPAGGFATGELPDRFVPRFQEISVAVAEGCITVHVATDEAVRAELVIVGVEETARIGARDVAAVLDFADRLPGFPSGGVVQGIVRVVDRSGNGAESQPLALNLPGALPRVVISEVLANPAGSETTQELLELFNAGPEAVDLSTLVIADKTGSDVLPSAMLPSGGYAVVAGEKYDAQAGTDVAPCDGALLVRVPGRIGSDGLTNAGEVVRLLTLSGDVVSQYGGWIDTGPTVWSGKSVKRTAMDACDGPAAWGASPTSPTPGW